jgi:Cu+-exporting ATPase
MNKATQLSNKTSTLSFDVEGMTCAACAARIERVLNKNFTPEEITVSFPLKTAKIKLSDETDISSEEIIKKINSIGYQASLEKKEEVKRRNLFDWIIPIISLGLTIALRFLFEANLDSVAYVIGFIIVLIFGKSFHISAFKKIKFLDFNMDTLISIGSLSSLIISVLPNELLGSGNIFNGESKMFLDTGAFIISFILIGKTIEEKVIDDAVRSTSSLKSRIPKKILITRNGEKIESEIENLIEGDLFSVTVGEIIPTDGYIVNGSTNVDESLLTGESIPIAKHAGDSVIGGSINLEGLIEVKVDSDYTNSTYNIIEELIESAQTSKPKIQKSLDKVTQFFVPTVIGISLFTFFYKLIINNQTIFDSLAVAISVLVIACPCALGLATPIVIYKSSQLSKNRGFIFKSFDLLQRFSDIKSLVFDKTGTLSTGVFTIDSITNIDGNKSETEILKYIASVELHSKHPIARSLVYAAEKKDIEFFDAKEVKEVPGLGISGVVEGINVQIQKNKQSASTSLEVKINNETYLINLKEESSVSIDFVKEIKKEKDIFILSGDKEESVKRFAENIEISNYYSDKTPEEKLDIIKTLQQEVGPVIYVGDGINDSPSIKQSDVGVSTSTSSQIAQVTGDILINRGGIEKITDVIQLSKNSKNRIYQNLFLAFIYNSLMIPIAVAGLITPQLAALAMALSSISVVLNSNRKL